MELIKSAVDFSFKVKTKSPKQQLLYTNREDPQMKECCICCETSCVGRVAIRTRIFESGTKKLK